MTSRMAEWWLRTSWKLSYFVATCMRKEKCFSFCLTILGRRVNSCRAEFADLHFCRVCPHDWKKSLPYLDLALKKDCSVAEPSLLRKSEVQDPTPDKLGQLRSPGKQKGLQIQTLKFSVAEPKLFIFGSGSRSSYSHIMPLKTRVAEPPDFWAAPAPD